MSERPASAGPDGTLRRRGRIAAVTLDAIDITWLDAQCQGCVGCGGRCSLFAKAAGEVERLPIARVGMAPGTDVDVVMPARRLRRSASAAYGLALVALVLGAVAGHGLGGTFGFANVGALVGLLAGTFLAGRLTKRFAATPGLGVRASHPAHQESDPCRP